MFVSSSTSASVFLISGLLFHYDHKDARRMDCRQSVAVTKLRRDNPKILGMMSILTATLKAICFLLLAQSTYSIPLDGTPYRCSKEGAQVELKKLLHVEDSCNVCFCQNHVVQCRKTENCSSVDGCYRLLPEQPKECCQRCQGCLYKGNEVVHGTSWYEGCAYYQCQAGVLTSSKTQCHVPCARPLPPSNGECCPKCEGCWLEGRDIPEGGLTHPRADPCVKCLCKDGKLQCQKRTCPVLSCPANKAVLDQDGCCLTCQGSRNIFRVPGGGCFLGRQMYFMGNNRTHDACTTCQCDQGYLSCHRQSCPPLQCPEKYQQFLPGQCCPQCLYQVRSQVCVNQGIPRNHGETWKLDKCSTCHCKDGQVLCQVDRCASELFTSCPAGFKRGIPAGSCCPKCIPEKPAVCVTYGDPHYRTFDGHLFNFQGECRYDLVKDCVGKKFAVRVNNDARRSSYFSWTKSLSIKVNVGPKRYKISLGQKLRTKVDRRRVKLPFSDEGLSIAREGYSIRVTTSIGLHLVWDGASYVEVHASGEWRNRLCGLCGNFNGNSTDDKQMKNGEFAVTDEDMAHSWLSGKATTCRRRINERLIKTHGRKSETRPQIRTQRLTCPNSASETVRRCQIFNHTFLSECHPKIDVDSFYSSCLLDLCECPSPRICECDALVAYVRQCQRVGVDLDDWRFISKCGGFQCPHGAIFMSCAPACKPTCRNPFPNLKCHMKNCKPNCYCPDSTVLHKGGCIPLEKCPKRRNRRKGRRKRY